MANTAIAVASRYARVSSRDQNLALQDAQLRDAGAAKVYAEKISAPVPTGQSFSGPDTRL